MKKVRLWVAYFLIGMTLPLFAETVNFSREVLPILSDRCFHCHGPDGSERKAKLRLDLEEEAKRDRDGTQVIVPGDLEASDFWHRIITEDEDELMPPPDSHRKPLSKAERDTMRRWIEQGAVWGKHWAFEKPVRPDLPLASTKDKKKVNPIDAFIGDGLKREGLEASPRAEDHTLLRRVSFDLTGLPPTAEELKQLKQPLDWDALVEKKLASPHHGERLAMWWLDAARYSDTDGYQQDNDRSNWPWRDWVVKSFNDNMPFDQFTIEQFAGDLLPDATPEQILATCFHRNHMTNGEGGRLAEESRIDYVIDRVNTAGTVWMGLTLGCVQCHDHKFDPISQQDYYSLFAFFNSIEETGQAGGKANPYLSYQSPLVDGPLKEAEAYVKERQPIDAAAKVAATKRFDSWMEATRKTIEPDYKAWRALTPSAVGAAEGTLFDIEKGGTVQTSGPTPVQDDYRVSFSDFGDLKRITGWKLEVLPHASHTDGKLSRGKKGEFTLTNVKALIRRKGKAQEQDVEMSRAVADFEAKIKGSIYGKVQETLDDDPRRGWTTETGDPKVPHTAVFELKTPIEVHPDEEWTLVLSHRSTLGDANIGRFRISMTDQRGETVKGLKMAPLEAYAIAPDKSPEKTAALRKRLLEQFLLDDEAYQATKKRLVDAQQQVADIKKAMKPVKVQVLGERKDARDSHILVRGVWDAKGETVLPGGLSTVFPLPANADLTRIDLANWVVSSENPLTARVMVNHLWQLMFGAGLVRTPEDFGLQGEIPTHPELLDWLAVELVEEKWDIRHIIRLMVTSETYQQASMIRPELQELDPANRFLARSSRYRLPAWMIRDNALQSAGLLNPLVGGPPVRPWQPDGVWREIFMGRFTYRPSVGPAQYRRTLYAFWRRSSAPTFLFDSAQRRVCDVSIRRTNTPLHALTLLNDVTMLEASRVLAKRAGNLDDMGQRILSRPLTPSERKILEREQNKALTYYEAHPDEAMMLLTVGQQEPPAQSEKSQAPRLAAWMTTASMLLNLDEAMTHE